MLFPYVLHCFTVISAVSVLAAPLPGDSDNRIQLFDFNKAHDEEYHKRGRTVANILSEKGKKLARGNWLRKAHPKDVRQLPKVRTEVDIVVLKSLCNISCTCRAYQLEIFSPLEKSSRNSECSIVIKIAEPGI